MSSRANTGTQSLTHPHEHMAAKGDGIETGETAPGVTNRIALCLQALQQYDLVTKWHMDVLHALRWPGF